MKNSLFREGGPYKIRKTGVDTYSMRVPIPGDEHGRIARECPDQECSPGYFKVTPGTGITEGQNVAYCPYCRHGNDPSEFGTREHLRYAKDVMMREAREGIGRMVKDAFGLDPSGRRKLGGGLIAIGLSYKPGLRPHVRRPIEEELLRAVVCPHCGLDHAVFGLATWCSDCGRDIFMAHVEAECEVVRRMLSDVDRRRKDFGARIAARDVENGLEDTVSIYEAVLKALFVRARREMGEKDEHIQTALAKRIRNAFQNVELSAEVVEREFGTPLLVPPDPGTLRKLASTFEKRHPITHNLGVVDRKYLESGLSAEKEGREIRVTHDEVLEALSLSLKILANLHARLFPQAGSEGTTGPPAGADAEDRAAQP